MSPFDGMSRDQLQAALTATQSAYIQLCSGQAVVTAAYAQGDGSKSISRRISSPAECLRLIQQLKRALGMRTGSRLRRLIYQ